MKDPLPNRPIENCYWGEPGRFLAGEYPRTPDEAPSLVKLYALVDAGVQAFINLTGKDEGLEPYHTLFSQCNAGPAAARAATTSSTSCCENKKKRE